MHETVTSLPNRQCPEQGRFFLLNTKHMQSRTLSLELYIYTRTLSLELHMQIQSRTLSLELCIYINIYILTRTLSSELHCGLGEQGAVLLVARRSSQLKRTVCIQVSKCPSLSKVFSFPCPEFYTCNDPHQSLAIATISIDFIFIYT